MSKATKRWQKTRAYIRKIPNINAQKLNVFENLCGEIELDEEEIGDALHVSRFTVGDKDKRLSLRSLELATIVENILTKRTALDKESYKAIATKVRSDHNKDSQQQLDQAVVLKINGLQSALTTDTYRVYIEEKDLGQIDKMSADLALPGSQTVKTEAHEKSYKKRLPDFVNVGPSINMNASGPWGVVPYKGEGNQDLVDFGTHKIRTVWTNDISFCVPVVFLFGSLPEYSVMTFTHLPGGNVKLCNWDWMFLQNLPGNKAFNYGAPSKVIIAYNPHSLDASTLECLEILKNRVPPQNVIVYGFNQGNNFVIDKYGFFGMIDSHPTGTTRFDQNPNYFGNHLTDWLDKHHKG